MLAWISAKLGPSAPWRATARKPRFQTGCSQLTLIVAMSTPGQNAPVIDDIPNPGGTLMIRFLI